MREKEEANERARLELEEKFNREMAAALQSNGGKATGGTDGTGPTKELLNTIESLHKRYAMAEKAWATAKQDAEEAKRRATAELERKFTREKASLQVRNPAWLGCSGPPRAPPPPYLVPLTPCLRCRAVYQHEPRGTHRSAAAAIDADDEGRVGGAAA